ncbi:MAG: DNA (cytosine-5-)-methyltransferase [Clostridia bacterium]
MKNFTFIDLFSGLGGFRLALESVGGKCLLSSDIDKHVRETYKLNFGDYPYGDISQIKTEDIPYHDILCAGFPCQPFSIGGKRLGFEDARGTLFFEVARILKEKQPKALFLENVAGIISHNQGNTISIICSILNELGYDFSWERMNAKDHGIPQNRNRWYGVGFRKDLNLKDKFSFPKKCDLKFTVNDIIEQSCSADYTITDTAKKNINTFLDEFKNTSRYNNANILIANEVRASRCNFKSDGIAPCLTAKMGTGGNNVPIVVAQNRKLTEKECLALMGFPKNYKIKANNMQSYKQIGNSVCVPIIEEIAQKIISIL